MAASMVVALSEGSIKLLPKQKGEFGKEKRPRTKIKSGCVSENWKDKTLPLSPTRDPGRFPDLLFCRLWRESLSAQHFHSGETITP